MWKAFIALTLMTTAAFAQEAPTAYEALRAVGAQYGRAAVNHVISVIGIDGKPQPRVWHVLLEDRRVGSGAREILVENNRVTGDRPANNAPGATTISTSKLNLDSSGAYQVAAHTADTSHVVFTYVNYTLRTDPRGNPTWIVTLQSNTRQPLGTIHVGANKGTITRVEGMYSGRNIEQVADDRTLAEPVRERRRDRTEDVAENRSDDNADDDDGDVNIVKRQIKQAFRRTKRDASDMFDNVRRSFADFIDPRR